jgi:16S rRNA (guanine(966)-N(2))-methyltransferase RsmD
MRIISGIYKSRILKSPNKAETARPTTDRARETLFNMLNNLLEFEEIFCLDLYCGTGSFGLECVSRGAEQAVFVDTNTRIIDENIESLKAGDKCSVIKKDVLSYLKKDYDGMCNLVFADPPYAYKNYDELIHLISPYEAYLILEHSEKFNYFGEYSPQIFLTKKIGFTCFTFFNFNK